MMVLMMVKTIRRIEGVVKAATTVMVKTTGMKRAPIVKLAPRRLILLDESSLSEQSLLMLNNYKLVYLWIVTTLLNYCPVNFNLRRSCKVGLCTM
jgi:hypothetical protein